jgi:hypothetical protein
MAVTYSTTLKNNRMQLVADLIDGKTAAASTGSVTSGLLVIGTSALSGATGVLATITLDATTCGSVSGGVLTFDTTPALSATASAGGTAAKAEFRTSGGTVIVSGLTVGTSGSDINLNSTTISASQTVTITSGTITHG